MAIERDGLDYSIKVKDEFSANLQKFVTDVEAARAAFNSLRDDALGKRTINLNIKQAIDDTTTARRRSNAATDDGIKSEKQLTAEKEKQRKAELLLASLKERYQNATGLKQYLEKERQVTGELEKQRRAELALAQLREREQNRIGAKQFASDQAARDKALKDAEKAAAKDQAAVEKLAKQDADRIASNLEAQKKAELELAQLRENYQNQVGTAAYKKQLADKKKLDQQAAKEKAVAEAKAAKDQQAELDKLDGKSNQLLFTFRRLFGVLALFTIAREAFRGLRQAITDAFGTNSAIQNATLGIQSLLTATGTLSTATGRVATGMEKFVLAEVEARRQVNLLRVDALRTAGTFEQLVETFQVGLAPGLRAGLNPDQIRKFAVQISQAAASIGLPQNQLSEEIRSILSGTIQARTTRIATSLGITNEDIRRAKEAGTLAQFLLDKFSAFQFAGQNALNNFSVLIEKVKDSIKGILAEGGRPVFEELTLGLKAFLSDVTKITPEGIIFSPKLVDLAREFFNILRAAVGSAIEIARSFTLEGAVSTLHTIGVVLISLISLATDFAKGFSAGFNVMFAVLKTSVGIVQKIVSFLGRFPVDLFQALVTALGASFGLLTGIRLIVFAITSPAALIVSTFSRLSQLFTAILPGAAALLETIKATQVGAFLLSGPFLVLLAIVGLVIAAFSSDFIRSITIAGVRIGFLADLVKEELGLVLDLVVSNFKAGWIEAINAIQRAFNRVVEFFASAGLFVAEKVLAILNLVGDFQSEIDALSKARSELGKGVDEENARLAGEAKKRVDEINAQIEARKRLNEQRLKEIAAEDATAPRRTIKEALTESLTDLGHVLDSTINTTNETAKQVDNYRKILEFLEKIPATISQTREELAQQGELLTQFRDRLAASADELNFSRLTSGLSGFEKEALGIFTKSNAELRDASRQFNVEIQQAEASLKGIASSQADITAEIRAQTGLSDQQIAQITKSAAVFADFESQRKTTVGLIRVAEQSLIEAQQAGQKDLIAALTITIAKRKEELGTIETGSVRTRAAVVEFLQSLGLTGEAFDKVLASITKLVGLQSSQIANQKIVADATRDLDTIQTEVGKRRINELRAQNAEEKHRLDLAVARAAAELRGAQPLAAVANLPEVGTQNQTARDLADLAQKLEITAAETDEKLKQHILEIQALQDLRERVRGTAAEAEVIAITTEKQKLFTLEAAKSKAEVDALQVKYQKLREIIEEPVDAGFNQAITEFATTAEDAFARTKKITDEFLNGLASTFADTISDALDPTKKLDIYARFRDFFARLTNLIIEEFAKLAIVRALLEPLGLVPDAGGTAAATAAATTAIAAAAQAAASAALAAAQAAEAATLVTTASIIKAGGIGSVGFWQGGLIGGRGRASPAHANAQGLAGGGFARPRGLHPSDTVPIWAAPGEFMQPRAAVNRYGVEVMEALRRGIVNPDIMRGLAGVRGLSASRTAVSTGRVGFATGGQIGRGDGARSQNVNPDVNLKVVNVNDRRSLLEELASRDGERIVVNLVRANRNAIFR